MSRCESFIPRLLQCAELLRLGRDVEGVSLMVESFDQLMPVFTQASLQAQQVWMQMLSHMLECQETQNWLGLADYLQYELPELLADQD